MSWNDLMAQGLELCDCAFDSMAEILRKRVVSDGNDYVAIPYGYDVENDPDGLMDEDFRHKHWHMNEVPLDSDVLARTVMLCHKILENGESLPKPEKREQFWDAGLGIAMAVLAPESGTGSLGEFARKYREAAMDCLEPGMLDLGYDEDTGNLYAWFRIKNGADQEEADSGFPAP